jgi:lipopolysaccharide/colanic/teichoic acid biosynthesis glycosyltransferase
MQIETIYDVKGAAPRHYKKADRLPLPKANYSFLYIGKNKQNKEFLDSLFYNGFAAENFEDAVIKYKENVYKNIDVLIVDTAFNEPELRNFRCFLLTELKEVPPVIYNEKFILNKQVAQKHIDIIDDVVDLSNWQYDFSNKLSFIKKEKAYQKELLQNMADIEPADFILKRILDIVISGILLIILAPVFILIAIAIKLESRGPVFYNSKRAGKGYKIFKFHKFRTMEVNADKKVEQLYSLNQYGNNDGAKFFKISNDPRITKVGKILRNTSLDELPQLFNVLKGQMSLVGNRPLPLYEAATLTTNDCVERFMAPAGITGLWQIKKRGQSDMSAEERVNLDITYARKFNLLYDFWIMARTPAALFQKDNV